MSQIDTVPKEVMEQVDKDVENFGIAYLLKENGVFRRINPLDVFQVVGEKKEKT